MNLSAELVEAFSGTFLSPRYDNPQPTPEFHREAWKLYCSEEENVALAAPREHAKSTALTHDFGLATVLFRDQDYVIIVSASEEMAVEHLTNISAELHENEDLIREFQIKGFITDQKTDIVVECQDGHQFRMLARGAEQKIRGRRWRGKRPGLILCDDVEDDEQVESKERREKFRRWFFRAAKQALRNGGKMRIHGTILHEDSLLARLMKDKNWKHLLYRAHHSFDDFRNILWPQQWPEKRLRKRRDEFSSQGDIGGYSAEFLNDPLDNDERYFRSSDFLPMEEDDYGISLLVCAAADFAVSKADKADSTSFSIGGKSLTNILHIIDQRKGRWDALQIIEEMFLVQAAWNPVVFFVEGGTIWNAISPMLHREMQNRDIWINVQPITSLKDKATRGRSLQKRMRGRGVKFDKQGDWYPGLESEMLRFTGYNRAIHDDQVDSMSLLSLGFDNLADVVREDFYEEEDFEQDRQERKVKHTGRNQTTGY